jgi:hypothetical protein
LTGEFKPQQLGIKLLTLNLGPRNPDNMLKYQFENWISLKAFLETDIVKRYFNYKLDLSEPSVLKVMTLLLLNFIRNQSQIRFHLNKNWIGSIKRFEDQKKINR